MKNMKYGLLFGLAAAALMLLAACQNGSSPSAGSTVKSNYGKVKIITAGGGAGRTILPPDGVDPFSSYTYVFKDKDGTPLTDEEGNPVSDTPDANGVFKLPLGEDYTVGVTAYIDNGGTPIKAAEGVSEKFNVTADSHGNPEVTEVRVKLSVVSTSLGKGSFRYTISYPKDADLELVLKQWPDGTEETLTPSEISEVGDTKKSGETLDDLEVGSYLLTILVKDTAKSKYAGLVQAVHIFPGLTTERDEVFTNLVQTSNDATLAGITIDNVGNLVKGDEKADISQIITSGSGRYNAPFGDDIKSEGLIVSVTPNDKFATVRFAMAPDTDDADDLDEWVDGEGFDEKTPKVALKPMKDTDVLFVEVTSADGSKKLYSKVEITYLKVFTITFDKNGGDTEADPKTIDITEAYVPPTTITALPTTEPTRDGYSFVGWYTVPEDSGGDEIFEGFEIDGDITAYARWEAITYTVTFDANNNDTSGTTPPDPASIDSIVANGNVDNLPDPPTRSEGWGAGMVFASWNTEADGTGDTFDETTTVTDDITVYAIWSFVAGEPTVVGDTLEHKAPALTTNQGAGGAQGIWDGTTNSDGSFTYSAGAVRYQFPIGYGDYDFFTIYYVSADFTKSNWAKQYDNSTGYPDRTGNGYPNLSASGSLNYLVKDAGSTGGIAFQAGDSASRTLKITKVVFTKGVRHTITFDTDGGNNIDNLTITEGIPFSLPPAVKSGFNFKGWKDDEGNDVTISTVITKDLTLIAQWEEQTVQAQKIDVNFKTANVVGYGNGFSDSGALVEVNEDGSGYELTFGSANGYGGTWVKFEIDLVSGVYLSNYKTVTFTLQGTAGDLSYKQVSVLGDVNLGTGQAPESKYITTVDKKQYNNGIASMSFDIDPGSTATMTGKLEISIFVSAGNSSSNTNNGNTVGTTVFKVSNVSFNVE